MKPRFGICPLTFISCRKEPAHASEMVTQLLFGEHFQVLKKKNSWYYIKNAFDGYESWVDIKTIQMLPADEYEIINQSVKCYTSTLLSKAVHLKNKTMLNLVIGSKLPFYDGKKFRLGKDEYELTGKTTVIQYQEFSGQQPSARVQSLMSNLIAVYRNAPYLWGGRTPFGIDCSGFTQMIFKLSGIFLPRDSQQQAELGEIVPSLDKCLTGDLAFFKTTGDKITHVGIVINDEKKPQPEISSTVTEVEKSETPQPFSCKITHASGLVRTDKLDEKGIFNPKLRRYTHQLVCVKRLLQYKTN